jgi:hypothetical protein
MSLFSKIVCGVILANGFAMAGNGLLLGGGLNLSSISRSKDLPSEYKESMRTGFNLGAGFEIGIVPMFSIIPGVSLETRGQDVKVTDPDYGDVKDETKLLYPAGPGAIAIRPGYSFSLTDFDDSEPGPDFPEVEVKNSNIKLAVAYKIPL